MHENVVIC